MRDDILQARIKEDRAEALVLFALPFTQEPFGAYEPFHIIGGLKVVDGDLFGH